MATQTQSEFPESSPKRGDLVQLQCPATRYLPLAGRVLFSSIFVASGVRHFKPEYVDYAAQHGVPFPKVTVPLSGLVALAGGLSVLLGYRPRMGAGLLAMFLVPVTSFMHRFWAEEEPMRRQEQMAHFMKNTAMTGATLMLAHFGSGPLSLENCGKSRGR